MGLKAFFANLVKSYLERVSGAAKRKDDDRRRNATVSVTIVYKPRVIRAVGYSINCAELLGEFNSIGRYDDLIEVDSPEEGAGDEPVSCEIDRVNPGDRIFFGTETRDGHGEGTIVKVDCAHGETLYLEIDEKGHVEPRKSFESRE